MTSIGSNKKRRERFRSKRRRDSKQCSSQSLMAFRYLPLWIPIMARLLEWLLKVSGLDVDK